MPTDATSHGLRMFDRELLSSLLARLKLPSFSDLPHAVAVSLSQPGRNGGLGVRRLEMVSAAAKWASASAAAPDLAGLVPPPPPSDHPPLDLQPLPPNFILDRERAYAQLVDGGVDVSQDNTHPIAQSDSPSSQHHSPFVVTPKKYFLPPTADLIATFYHGELKIPELQRSLTHQLEDRVLSVFRSGGHCTMDDTIRMDSCRLVRSGRVLASPHALSLPDHVTSLTVRLLTGLPPQDAVPAHCPLCGAALNGQHWHAFACVKLRRLAVTTRHNAAMNLLCEFARSHGALCRLEPKDESSLIPDGEFILPRSTVLVDASGTHPHAPSYRHASFRRPGSAIVTRENAKHVKYDAYAEAQDADMVAFVLDTYGRLGEDGQRFLKQVVAESSLASPSPYAISKPELLDRLLVTWHRHNALVLVQWSARCRNVSLRRVRAEYRLSISG
jgi:hypothetical protein